MSDERLVVIAVMNFLMGIISGIGGGGGGFVMTPLLIFLGLTPQQAVASGKIGGLGVTLGSLQGLSKAKIHRWKPVLLLMLLATVVGLVTPHIITGLDNAAYRKILGGLLLALIPVILIKRVGHVATNPPTWQKLLAIPVLLLTLLLQGVFSGGMGSLVVLTLMGLLGMSALEANVTKRFSQVILNVLIVLGLLGSRLIIWKVALALFMSGSLGGLIGSHIALKKGDKFVAYAFAILMFISGIELLLG